MITNHVTYSPFSALAIAERTPYVRGHEIRWADEHRHKYASAMAEYLDLCDGEDEATGNANEWFAYYRRFGKRILVCNSQGFVDVWRYASEDEAIDEFTTIDADYCRAMDDEDEDTIVGATQDEDEDETSEGEDEDEAPRVWCDVHEAPHAPGDLACEVATSENMTKSTLADVRALNAWQLAHLADVPSPDSLESPGALFLASVRDSLVDAAGEVGRLVDDEGCIVGDDEASDLAHELADETTPIYTHDVWAQFVDLSAYNEDLEGYVDESTTMEARARLALYCIAERLVLALVDEVRDLDEL